MVHVVKKGGRDPEEWLTVKCHHCGAKLAFQRKEAKRQPDQRDGDAYSIKCPEGPHEVWIDASVFADMRGSKERP